MDEKDCAQTPLPCDPPPGSRWRHFKGGLYRVVCVAVQEDTLERFVVYRSEVKRYVWARRLDDFNGLHQGHGVRRFVRIDSPVSRAWLLAGLAGLLAFGLASLWLLFSALR